MVDELKIKFDVNKNYTNPYRIEGQHKRKQLKKKPIE